VSASRTALKCRPLSRRNICSWGAAVNPFTAKRHGRRRLPALGPACISLPLLMQIVCSIKLRQMLLQQLPLLLLLLLLVMTLTCKKGGVAALGVACVWSWRRFSQSAFRHARQFHLAEAQWRQWNPFTIPLPPPIPIPPPLPLQGHILPSFGKCSGNWKWSWLVTGYCRPEHHSALSIK